MPSKERVEHRFQGDGELCHRCDKSSRYHRAPRVRVDIRERDERIYLPRERKLTYVGIDGEGLGRENHCYTLLAASDETGEHVWSIENQSGLRTVEILEFLAAFPPWVKLFSYGFNYDLTKMLEDLPDNVLYKLFRPELRQRFGIDAFKDAGDEVFCSQEWTESLHDRLGYHSVFSEQVYNGADGLENWPQV